MSQLSHTDLFNWISEQPDDRKIHMGECVKNSTFAHGCILMQYNEARNLDCHSAGYNELRGKTGGSFDGTSKATGRPIVDTYILHCLRNKCLTFADAKEHLATIRKEHLDE